MIESAVYINKISTAVPDYEIHTQTLELLKNLAVTDENKSKLEHLNQKCQIEKRYSVLSQLVDLDESHPEAFYNFKRFPTTADRMTRYQQEALPLASNAIENLLPKTIRNKITHLIITSCTGFYAPGLDIDIVQKFNFNPSIERSLIGFMGCYAAIPALKLAHHIVRSQTDAQVLILNIELCTLHWRIEAPPDQLVTFLLFADGCAASVVSAKPVGLKLNGFYNTILPNTLPYMKWTIGNDGFYMNLDPVIPKQLALALHQEKSKILNQKNPSDITLWAIHPGGRSILDAAKNTFELSDVAIAASRNVLRNYGNMSSATVMFVLKQLLEDATLHGEGCGMAFGPGLSLETMAFSKESP